MLIERWHIYNPKGIDGNPNNDVWEVNQVSDQIVVSNITAVCFVTRYSLKEDWRTRLEQVACYYLGGDIVKIVDAEGNERPGITKHAWYDREYK